MSGELICVDAILSSESEGGIEGELKDIRNRIRKISEELRKIKEKNDKRDEDTGRLRLPVF